MRSLTGDEDFFSFFYKFYCFAIKINKMIPLIYVYVLKTLNEMYKKMHEIIFLLCILKYHRILYNFYLMVFLKLEIWTFTFLYKIRSHFEIYIIILI